MKLPFFICLRKDRDSFLRKRLRRLRTLGSNPLYEKRKSNDFLFQRKDRDSNPGNAFDVYTLSRRASSTTRAPFRIAFAKIVLFAIISSFCFDFFACRRLCSWFHASVSSICFDGLRKEKCENDVRDFVSASAWSFALFIRDSICV